MSRPFTLWRRLAAALTLLACTSAWAATDPNITLSGPTQRTIGFKTYNNLYALTVRQLPEDSGWDQVLFNKVDQPLSLFDWTASSQLEYVTTTLAADINMYMVDEGQTFAVAGVNAKQYPSLRGGQVEVPLTGGLLAPQSFYLAVRTASTQDLTTSSGWRYSLGWLRLTNTASGGLKVTDSFLAYDVPSIVVGVVSVPEPGTFALLLTGLLALTWARRKA